MAKKHHQLTTPLLIAIAVTLCAYAFFLMFHVFSHATFAQSTQPKSIMPSIETSACRNSGDTCDDSAIWIHPTNAAHSTIIGDDKDGGILVWDLTGTELQYLDAGFRINNLDLRYHFPLNGTFSTGESHTSVAIVTAINETSGALRFYKINPKTRLLEFAGEQTLSKANPYGGCMYHSPVTGDYYFFVNWKDGSWQQLQLVPSGNAQMSAIFASVRRSGSVSSQTEGCVADDIHKIYYLGQESTGVWRYGAEPTDGDTKLLINTGSELVADTEGMSLYYRTDGGGYLIVSSQGNSTFAVYERAKSIQEPPNTYIDSFRLTASTTIDATSSTDGLDMTNFPLGPSYPQGLFVAHDNSNSGASASNHKLVPFDRIANHLGLTMDTTWDPREIGKPQTIPPTITPSIPPTTITPSVTIDPSSTPYPPFQCPKKQEGDADCTGTINLADFQIWRNEYLSGCSLANPTGCGPDEDGDSLAMDANFNYPSSAHQTPDTIVTLLDYQIWRNGYFAAAGF